MTRNPITPADAVDWAGAFATINGWARRGHSCRIEILPHLRVLSADELRDLDAELRPHGLRLMASGDGINAYVDNAHALGGAS